MPLRLDNAKRRCPHAHSRATEENKNIEPRFKVDLAATPMPEIRQPERLTPGRHQIGMVGEIISEWVGEIKSEYPGEIVGISKALSVALTLGMGGLTEDHGLWVDG